MQQEVTSTNLNSNANKGRGLVGKKKCYDAAKVAEWRKIKTEQRLTYVKLAKVVGVHPRTLERAFNEF